MTTIVHFIDVGQGNMALVECANGDNFVVDCNITEDNQDRVLKYVAAQIGWGTKLKAFICSHRDADHIRGVRDLHNKFPIQSIWDSDYPGTSTDSSEYKAYMRLRREVGFRVIQKKTSNDYGRTRFRYMSAKDDRLPDNANAQGIVMKVEQRTSDGSSVRGSTMLTGDSDAATWKNGILEDYSSRDVSCNVLLAGHHGSITFFDDPDDSENYYTAHVKAMTSTIVVISVGENSYGHPDSKALELYRKYSKGASNGRKIFRTDKEHTMKLTLKTGGGWTLDPNQKA